MNSAMVGKLLLYVLLAAMFLLPASCSSNDNEENPDRRVLAEKFLRGVYGGKPDVVDELAAEDILISYPIFQEIFGRPAIRGREAAMNFATSFSQRWVKPEITIHEAISEGQSVVLIWSISAVDAGAAVDGEAAGTSRQYWGGISVYRFDESGKIKVEFGEESTPGPGARLE